MSLSFDLIMAFFACLGEEPAKFLHFSNYVIFSMSFALFCDQILKIAKVDSRLRKYFACNMTLLLEYPTMKEMLTLYTNGSDYHYKPMYENTNK